MRKGAKVERIKFGGRLWLPARMVRLIPPDMHFQPEFTEDGVLFRIVPPTEEPKVPSWANGHAD